jgi:Subtilase family/Fibronectin type-III domain/PA domain
MRHRTLVGAFAFILVVAVSSTAVSAQTSTDDFRVVGDVIEIGRSDEPKSLTGQLAKTPQSLLDSESSELINVIIKLDYDPASVYAGGIRGLAATSPSVTGRPLEESRRAVAEYDDFVEDFESQAIRAIRARVPSTQIGQSFQLAYGGLSAQVPADQVRALLATPGVAAVQPDRLEQPTQVVEPYQFIGAEAVWPSLGGSDHAGEGVLVANIDTGIWPENPMLEDKGLPEPPLSYGCEFGLSGDLNDPAFGCNTDSNKVVGAYAFTDTYTTVFGALPGEFCSNTPGPGPWLCSARDADGHGTHTITTAAGDFVESAPMWGIDRGPTSGMAPGAWVIGYRVCLQQGCFPSDSVAAVDQAIDDEVDVLNFSISGGNNAYADAVELAFLTAYGAGILVNASAGNAGPGPGTANHAGPWVNTVGASYPSRIYHADLHLQAPGGATLEASGVTITPPIETALPVVLPGSVNGYTGNATCNVNFPAGSLTGMIVLCNRGNPAGRADSGFRALQGGAAGMILINVGHQDLFTDLHWLPAIMLDDGMWQGVQQPGQAVRDFVTANSGVTATFTTGERTEQVPDIMTGFSSRGPLGDWIKPDVTAPGIEILAGRSPHPHPGAIPSGPPGDDFMAIAGTSMSSPHAAGVSALVKAAHPDWTPGQIKSALMTSSVQSVLQPDGVTPADPFNTGAGSIRADRAISPVVVFDETAATYLALGADPVHRIDANLPSINAPTFSGAVTTSRTFTNVSGRSQQLTVTTSAPAGASITVNQAKFGMDPGQTKTLTFTITGEGLAPNTQYFGSIKMDPKAAGANDIYIPVAFFTQQGNVTLAQSCTPSSIPVGMSSTCTVTAENRVPAQATTQITEMTPSPSGLPIQNVQVAELDRAATTSLQVNGVNGYTWNGTLDGTVAPPIETILPGSTPADGYLPISAIPPIMGMGDETLANFNVPAFQWGREVYTRIGVDSNGYVVIGGGSGPDNAFIPQTFPNPARPNNVIAPWWTDINLAAPGCVAPCGARIATLTDTVTGDRWLIVDWQDVPTFGFTDAAHRHDFQIWLGLNNDPSPVEDVTIAYGDVGIGSTDGLNAGAENRDGSSGINITPLPVDGAQYVITTSGPLPGGKVVLTFEAEGAQAGDYVLTARMTSNVTVGATSVSSSIHVGGP